MEPIWVNENKNVFYQRKEERKDNKKGRGMDGSRVGSWMSQTEITIRMNQVKKPKQSTGES